MPKKDFSQVAFDVVQQATGETIEPVTRTPRQENSSKGGVKGGPARAAKLTPEQRSAIATIAAKKKWSNKQ